MYIVGLISGTSADAIDAALCEIDGTPPHLNVRIVNAITHPNPEGFQKRVHAAGLPADSHVDEICRLNVAVGELFAQAALQVIADAGMTPTDVDLIGSHGQTVWHDVEADGRVSSTLQLGEAAIIAERTGITTLSNFRPRDVAAGGQGAPMTAYVDWVLLRHPDHWRAVQNIGGVGNVTFLPPLSDTTSAPLAFDTGPGNALMDAAMLLLTDGKRSYDRGGELARLGTVNDGWVKQRMMHPYITRRPPKTTGREEFGAPLAASLVTASQRLGMSNQDIMASLTAYTAQSIAYSYKRFAPAPMTEVIIGGGGRHNRTLISMLRELLAPAQILSHEDIGLDSDNKEAMVFALLAHETWHNRIGTLPALTGAKHATVLGQITPGDNYARLMRRTWGA